MCICVAHHINCYIFHLACGVDVGSRSALGAVVRLLSVPVSWYQEMYMCLSIAVEVITIL